MLFYDLMWYNYPKNKAYFSISKDLLKWVNYDIKIKKRFISDVSKFEKTINKYSFLYKNIPFVKNIYICNSLTFKSVHKNSDIDLFIVVKKNRIFLAKFFVWLFFKIFWIYWTHKAWKFCTWFFVTDLALDLYPISLSLDLYLAYWIAHLQILYSEKKEEENNVFKENIWVKNIVPNYNYKECKILDINKVYWNWFMKKILEKLFWWDFLNNIIWFFWKKKMRLWKKKLWKIWKDIIISDNILKFQAPDIRKIIYLRYKSLKVSKYNKLIKDKNLF